MILNTSVILMPTVRVLVDCMARWEGSRQQHTHTYIRACAACCLPLDPTVQVTAAANAAAAAADTAAKADSYSN